MDPTQALLDAIDYAKDGVYPQESLDALLSWLRQGGFAPDLSRIPAAEWEQIQAGRIGGMRMKLTHRRALVSLVRVPRQRGNGSW